MRRPQPPAPVQGLRDLDRTVHEPARLAILTVLAAAGEVEFRFLETATGLTCGNLSAHVSKLEASEYVAVTKAFRGKVPVTSMQITPAGRQALMDYRRSLLAALGAHQ